MDIDFIRLGKVYERILKISEEERGVFEKIISESITNIEDQLKERYNSEVFQFYSLSVSRILAIWLSHERLFDPQYGELVIEISKIFFEIEGLKCWDRDSAANSFSTLNQNHLLCCFKVNQQHLTFILIMEPEESDTDEYNKIRKLLLIMDFFYFSSRKVKIKAIDLKEFHIDVINNEWTKKLPKFYLDWYHCRRGYYGEDMEIDYETSPVDLDKRTFFKVLFIEYPWIFDASNKSRLFNYEGQITRKKEVNNSMDIQNLLMGGLNIYLIVEVGRDTLIEDSLNSLVSAGKNLK